MVVKNFGEFGELQVICQSFFANFYSLNRTAYGPWQNIWSLVYSSILYSLLVYQHQACGTVVTIGCISITN